MKCPHCVDATLLMSERRGVEIDYCPQCRGVWLDRGELDKLIAISGDSASAVPVQPQAHGHHGRQPDFADADFNRSSGHGHRRRKSWLSEIFD